MKIYRYLYNGNVELGIEKGNRISKIKGYNNLIHLLKDGYNSKEKLEIILSENTIDINEIKILSPIDKPIHDVICVGKNYVEHISELGGDITADFIPNYFGKRALRILGTGEEIKGLYEIDENIDYEVELAVIISKETRNIKGKEIYNHIFGLSIFNDISSRHLQNHHKQWYRGKSIDNYSVFGPCIVTIDEFNIPLKLNLCTRINGEIRQNSNTEKMIFTIEDIIEDLSSTMTLEAGDIISTGTPSGVGKGFKPPKYLKSGDIIEMQIEKIGKLINTII